METVRKTYQEKLKPTPNQERALEAILWRCRTLYNTALEQRISLYRQRGVSTSPYQQEAELKDLRANLPDYAAIHSHMLQEVLARLDKTYQAFFRRNCRKAEREQKKAQNRIARRKKGGARRKKAVAQCTKTHQHVRRQRADFHHKTALALVRQSDVIYPEVIHPANLSRRPAPIAD